MPAWKPIVGLSFQPDEFANYCNTLHFTTWRPSFIVLHNTYNPDLASRPNGLTKQNILDLEVYYRDIMKWSAGPHLFVDDHQIWVFTPLTTSGVHSPSWNNVSWGVEMLGDYNKEAFDSGRGLAVQNNAVAALRILYSTLGIEVTDKTLRLHKEDPLTTHKNCPGKNVIKKEVINKVKSSIVALNKGEHILQPKAKRHINNMILKSYF
jgi:N-acetylmuramoyl-L-alanine amidase CwlA